MTREVVTEPAMENMQPPRQTANPKRRFQRRCSVTEHTIAAVRRLSFSFLLEDTSEEHDYPSSPRRFHHHHHHDTPLKIDSVNVLKPILTTSGILEQRGKDAESIRRLALLYPELLVSDKTKLPSNYLTRPETVESVLSETVRIFTTTEKEQDEESRVSRVGTESIVTNVSNKKRKLL